MAERPVSAPDYDPTSWRLAPPSDKRVQGLVVSGFADSLGARALFLEFSPGDAVDRIGGAWLKALSDVAPITDADGKDSRSAAIAFTWVGLRVLGLDESVLQSFDRPFKEGMFQEDRLRRLGDKREGAWSSTVVTGGPQWSGNVHVEAAPGQASPHAYAVAAHRADVGAPTPITVHALLLLYERDDAAAERWGKQVEAAIAPFGVTIAHQLNLRLQPDKRGYGHEHFGFADGVSQPLPFEQDVVKVRAGADAPTTDSLHRVPLGEILLGHLNGHHEIAQGPAAPADEKAIRAGLPLSRRAEGFVDLGLDGSYMVVRELKQDVAEFWRSMDEAAQRMNAAAAPGAAPVDADWIASRVVGRNIDGDLLTEGGALPATASNEPENEFTFFDRDPLGRGCPLGSHVRRANPRDGLASKAEFKSTLLSAANNHRILRRGRKFGPDLPRGHEDDGEDRGLLFMCLNTDISRQFEFVQQTWILNQNFARLFGEVDPLVGSQGDFTIPGEGLRRIAPISTFIKMAGGEYFFLPSLPALRYLEAL